MDERQGRTHYDWLGVSPDVDAPALKAAYRRRARELHPDLRSQRDSEAQLAMARLNAAWHALSDPARRAAYDRVLRSGATRPTSSPGAAPRRPGSTSARRASPGPAASTGWGTTKVGATPPPSGARKAAWAASMRAQIRRLAAQAARSATQTMLVRHPGRDRQEFEQLAAAIVDQVGADAAGRVRAARATGAAPLDLALVAALIGVRAAGEELLRSVAGTARDDQRDRAEMLDRMWDTMAHELPHDLVVALGPLRITRDLRSRRR